MQGDADDVAHEGKYAETGRPGPSDVLTGLTEEERRRVRLWAYDDRPAPRAFKRPLTHTYSHGNISDGRCGHIAGERVAFDTTGMSRDVAMKLLAERDLGHVAELAIRAPQLTASEVLGLVPSAESLRQLLISARGKSRARLVVQHECLHSLLVENIDDRGTMALDIRGAPNLKEVVVVGGCLAGLGFLESRKLELLGLIDVRAIGAGAETRRRCRAVGAKQPQLRPPIDLRMLRKSEIAELHLQHVALSGDLTVIDEMIEGPFLRYLSLRESFLVGPMTLPKAKPCVLDVRRVGGSQQNFADLVDAWRRAQDIPEASPKDMTFQHPFWETCGGDWLYLGPMSEAEDDWLLRSSSWTYQPTLAREYAARAHDR